VLSLSSLLSLSVRPEGHRKKGNKTIFFHKSYRYSYCIKYILIFFLFFRQEFSRPRRIGCASDLTMTRRADAVLTRSLFFILFPIVLSLRCTEYHNIVYTYYNMMFGKRSLIFLPHLPPLCSAANQKHAMMRKTTWSQ